MLLSKSELKRVWGMGRCSVGCGPQRVDQADARMRVA